MCMPGVNECLLVWVWFVGCSFKDAVATVRRTTAEHQYQLVITRAYEEGEAELLDGDAESEYSRSPSSVRGSEMFYGVHHRSVAVGVELTSRLAPPSLAPSAEDERSFLIDASLHFRPSSFEGEPSFAWKDIDYEDEDDQANADEGELFEFVSDSKMVDKATLTVFELTMLHCMFERVRMPCSFAVLQLCR